MLKHQHELRKQVTKCPGHVAVELPGSDAACVHSGQQREISHLRYERHASDVSRISDHLDVACQSQL